MLKNPHVLFLTVLLEEYKLEFCNARTELNLVHFSQIYIWIKKKHINDFNAIIV